MSKFLVLAVLAVAAVANAQYIPWADELVRLNGTSTAVKQCGGSVQDNCYEQTAGQPDVVITGYSVASNKFPCTSGTTATSFSWDNKVALKEGTCQVSCDGFGCKQGTVQVCGADFGISCPAPTGAFTSVGKTTECQSGLGSYTVTIDCPNFTVVTYLSY